MSTPRDPREAHADPLAAAFQELLGASSALHMLPEPLDRDNIADGTRYLADADKWARHANEHINAAMGFLSQHFGRMP